MQTLLLRAEENVQIHEWLKRKNETYMYITKNIPNEMLKLIAHARLRQVTEELQGVKYYTIMADETTHARNKEQLVLVFCFVDNEL